MVKNTTYYLDTSVLSQHPTTLGWDKITLLERVLWRQVEFPTSPSGKMMVPEHEKTAKMTVFHYYWIARVTANGEDEIVQIDEEDLVNEGGLQYKLKPVKHKKSGAELSSGERRVVAVLGNRSYAVKASRLSEICGIGIDTLYNYISSLRTKGYKIEQRDGKYVPLKVAANGR